MTVWGNELLPWISEKDLEGYSERIEDSLPFTFRIDYNTLTIYKPSLFNIQRNDEIKLDTEHFEIKGIVDEVARKYNPDRLEIVLFNETYKLKKVCWLPYRFDSLTYLLNYANMDTEGNKIIDKIEASLNTNRLADNVEFKFKEVDVTLLDNGIEVESIDWYKEGDRYVIVVRYKNQVIGYSQKIYIIDKTYSGQDRFVSLSSTQTGNALSDLPSYIEDFYHIEEPEEWEKDEESLKVRNCYEDYIRERVENVRTIDYRYLKDIDTYIGIEMTKQNLLGEATVTRLRIAWYRNICSIFPSRFICDINNKDNKQFFDVVLDVCFLTDSIFTVKDDTLYVMPRESQINEINIHYDIDKILDIEQTTKETRDFSYKLRVIENLPENFVNNMLGYYREDKEILETTITAINRGQFKNINLLDRIKDGNYDFGTVIAKTYRDNGNRVEVITRKIGETTFWRV